MNLKSMTLPELTAVLKELGSPSSAPSRSIPGCTRASAPMTK